MIVAVLFGFILLLIAMGINALIGIPVWVAFIILCLIPFAFVAWDLLSERRPKRGR